VLGALWLGITGLVLSAVYLLNQGDILATAVPDFPVWDLAGPIGSTGWGLWVAALGVTVLLRPDHSGDPSGSDRGGAHAKAHVDEKSHVESSHPDERSQHDRARRN